LFVSVSQQKMSQNNSQQQQHQKQQENAAASVFHPVESKKGASANPGASKEPSAVARSGGATASNDVRQQEMAVSFF
jgi:hypothetical protein